MAFHHVALACRDTQATHRFYTECMGFELVKAVTGKTPGGGWAKHLFYDTGGDGLIAFWEIHDDAEVAADWKAAISTDLGLPPWVNHLAFRAEGAAEIEAHKRTWLERGHDVVEVDHGFCVSIYTTDPNGTLVEWCTDTRPLDADDRAEAARALADPNPELEPDPPVAVHRAKDYRG